MRSKTIFQEMQQKSARLWNAVFKHPCVSEIGNGTLARDRFEFYLKQYYVYLINLGWLFAIASVQFDYCFLR